MIINVCVGSSCHLKGSYDVIQKLKEMIEEKKLEDKIELKASFCLGNCSHGVAMNIDGEPLYDVNSTNIENVFNEQIITKL